MRKVIYIVAASLTLMFLYGFSSVVLNLPGLNYLSWVYPDALESWAGEPHSNLVLLLNVCMLLLPVFSLVLYLQERKRNAGDYTVAHDKGSITVSETALRRLIRGVCRDVPNIMDETIDLARSAVGLDISIRVKIDRAETWPFVKGELLKRVPEAIDRAVDGDIVGNLDIIWADFTNNDQSYPSLVGTPAPDVQPGPFEIEEDIVVIPEDESAARVMDDEPVEEEPVEEEAPEAPVVEEPVDEPEVVVDEAPIDEDETVVDDDEENEEKKEDNPFANL